MTKQETYSPPLVIRSAQVDRNDLSLPIGRVEGRLNSREPQSAELFSRSLRRRCEKLEAGRKKKLCFGPLSLPPSSSLPL